MKKFEDYYVHLGDGQKYCFHPGPFEDEVYMTKTFYYYFVKTVIPVSNEDWKTAIAHNQKAIPEGTELKVIDVFTNYYGKFLEVEYNDSIYYISPRDVEYVRCEKFVGTML